MQSIATFSASAVQIERFSFGSFLAGDQHIVLRRYREEDREFVLELLAEDGQSSADRRNPFIVQSDPLDIAAIYRGRSRLWVALCCDEIIGIVGMQVAGGVAWLRHLTVAKGWFGRREAVIEHLRRKAMVGALSQGLGELQLNGAVDHADDGMEKVFVGGRRSASAPPALFQHGRQPSACVYHLTI
jgi:hypothetical protein